MSKIVGDSVFVVNKVEMKPMNRTSIDEAASHLWRRLDEHPKLLVQLREIREAAETISASIARTMPGFTDHSVRHLDSLCRLVEVVLTPDEIDRMTPGEVFVLAAAIYVHDLGMAYGATPQGCEELRASRSYLAVLAKLTAAGVAPKDADASALVSAAREKHADMAEKFMVEPFPGLGRHILETSAVRLAWGEMIGKVAASHCWTLDRIVCELGPRGNVPDGTGGVVDLAYVACVLRVVDYAHINWQRAVQVERALRNAISPESAVHWDAQEFISGPVREATLLKFASMRAISSPDAWWTFFEMAKGCDAEIRDVAAYLASRTTSANRFSLAGVAGVHSPERFSSLVQSEGFDPIDVQVRPGSMDRLVELLGGASLYGNDPLVPLRELIQNASDAVHLRRAVCTDGQAAAIDWHVRVSLCKQGEARVLEVVDDGVGMSAETLVHYLLGVASSYWSSSSFRSEYGDVDLGAVGHAGRFGIGFLSVFMLGDVVEVETCRGDGVRLILKLEGAGSRGVLSRQYGPYPQGTRIMVRLREGLLEDGVDLAGAIRRRMPTLRNRIVVCSGSERSVIEAGWWSRASQEDFVSLFTNLPEAEAGMGPVRSRRDASDPIAAIQRFHARHRLAREDSLRLDLWARGAPEYVTENIRLVAEPKANHVVLCSRGFAVAQIDCPGFIGLVDDPDLKVVSARNRPVDFDAPALRQEVLGSVASSVVAGLDELAHVPDILGLLTRVKDVAATYGLEVLRRTVFPWVIVVSPPGGVRLLSYSDAVSELQRADAIRLVFGAIGIDRILSVASSYATEADSRSPVVLVPQAGQPDLRTGEPYETRDRLLEADLLSHLHTYGRRERASEARLADFPLLSVAIDLVATSLGSPRGAILSKTWRSFRSTLCVGLTRA